MSRTAVGRLLATAAITWAAALIVGAFIASRPEVGVVAYLISATIYEVGAVVCHQRPERSFHLWSAQLPVCARCAGIYGGAAVAAVAATCFAPSFQGPIDRQPLRAFLIAALPSGTTLLYEWTTGDMPGNWLRLVAGIPLGAIVGWILVRASSAGSRDTLTSRAR